MVHFGFRSIPSAYCCISKVENECFGCMQIPNITEYSKMKLCERHFNDYSVPTISTIAHINIERFGDSVTVILGQGRIHTDIFNTALCPAVFCPKIHVFMCTGAQRVGPELSVSNSTTPARCTPTD